MLNPLIRAVFSLSPWRILGINMQDFNLKVESKIIEPLKPLRNKDIVHKYRLMISLTKNNLSKLKNIIFLYTKKGEIQKIFYPNQ